MVNRMSKLEDHDQPEAYFHRFEETMKEAEISVEDWPHHLRPLLTGKALSAYSKNVPEQARLNYYDMKEALLSSLGLTVEQCHNEFWVLQRKYGESWQDTARKIDSMLERMTHGCSSIREVTDMFAMHKFYSLCPADCVDSSSSKVYRRSC